MAYHGTAVTWPAVVEGSFLGTAARFPYRSVVDSAQLGTDSPRTCTTDTRDSDLQGRTSSNGRPRTFGRGDARMTPLGPQLRTGYW